jgi:hypothetical protein
MSAPVKAMTGGGTTGGGTVTTVKVTMIGFVTVDEQPDDVLHGPVVMVAVFTTLPVALVASTALKVTVAVSPAARVTANVQVVPDVGFVIVHVSFVESVTAQDGVPWTVSVDGIGSLTVADPDPSPTFLMATL